MKTTLINVACTMALVALLGMPVTASAITVTITPTTQEAWSGTEPANPDAPATIAGLVGYSETLYFRYKMDDTASGSFAGSYTTTYLNPPEDPQDATIEWIVGQPVIGGTPKYLVVKDGQKVEPYWYIFNLSNLQNVDVGGNVTASYAWNGMDTLSLQGFWPDEGAISHVSIYSGKTDSDVPGTPDGGMTLLLLGSALTGVAALRRRLV